MNQANDMMSHPDGWMHGWGGGAWLWAGIGAVIVALLIVLIGKLAKR